MLIQNESRSVDKAKTYKWWRFWNVKFVIWITTACLENGRYFPKIIFRRITLITTRKKNIYRPLCKCINLVLIMLCSNESTFYGRENTLFKTRPVKIRLWAYFSLFSEHPVANFNKFPTDFHRKLQFLRSIFAVMITRWMHKTYSNRHLYTYVMCTRVSKWITRNSDRHCYLEKRLSIN